MNYFLRTFACASVLGLLVVGANAARPYWLAELGLDFWTLPDVEREVQHERARADALDAQRQAVMRGYEERRQVAADVIAGRMSLFAAAARFREVNDRLWKGWEERRAPFVTGSSEERLCLMVMDCAQTVLQDEGTDPAPVLARLQAELADHIRRNGGVRLP